MNMRNKGLLCSLVAAAVLAGCSGFQEMGEPEVPQGGLVPIALGSHIDQVYTTRAGQDGFAHGDKVGTFIVDWVDGAPGKLQLEGNRADNLYYTYNEPANRWVPSYDVYYKDERTPVDIYGYYPAAKPESVEAYAFEVQKDQRAEAANGQLSGYEQSDFLWAKAEKKTSADRIVWLNYTHRMAGIRVSLSEGTGFGEGEWASLSKDVLVQSTVRTATIDLSTGTVTASGAAPATGIIPVNEGGDFRCVVVPQTVPAGSKLITATVGGSAYDLVRDEAMVYVPGKQHNFTLTVNKRAAGSYEFELSGESITVWENDRTSHDGVAKEYVVINVETPGSLDACIAENGLEITKVRNLKLTGTINSRDFAVMRHRMTSLSALNLKEVRIVKGESGSLGSVYYNSSEDDAIPQESLSSKSSIVSLILPDRLVKIGQYAPKNTEEYESVISILLRKITNNMRLVLDY